MTKNLKLHAIYILHMLAPLQFVHWHIDRLSRVTLSGLSKMFPPKL